MTWIARYEELFNSLDFVIDLTYTIFVTWVISRIFHRLNILYGVQVSRRFKGPIAELLLALEIFFNILLWIITLTIFGFTHNIPLTGLLAGVSIGGLAISFAAQNTLQQLLGTVIILLDRPYTQGEHIRLSNGVYGRVESIGIRSTKIRMAIKGTLLIVPNSQMANAEIENVTRGSRLLIAYYCNFERPLQEFERALVKQIFVRRLETIFGIEPGNTEVEFTSESNSNRARARVSFLILGSTESSNEIRRRMFQLSSQEIMTDLQAYNLNFTTTEPVITLDTPMPL